MRERGVTESLLQLGWVLTTVFFKTTKATAMLFCYSPLNVLVEKAPVLFVFCLFCCYEDFAFKCGDVTTG